MQSYSPDDYYRATLYDQDGDKVGSVQQVYLNDDTGAPSWVAVETGFFGVNESLVPLEGAQLDDDVLTVPFDKQTIKDAPNFDPGHHLEESEEDDLYRYYGLGAAGQHDLPDSDLILPDRDVSDVDRGLSGQEHERELIDEERRDLADREVQLSKGERGRRPSLRRHLRDQRGLS